MKDALASAAADLWGRTPEDAVQRAIFAQSQSIWRTLWAQCLHASPARGAASHACAESSGVCSATGPAKADAAVIVAGVVLSVPIHSNSTALHATVEDANQQGDQSAATAQQDTRRYLCVSLGSGSRCLGVRTSPPVSSDERLHQIFEVRDGHAEVMARRGLIAFLMDLVEAAAADDASPLPFVQRINSAAATSSTSWLGVEGWTVQAGVRLHLVCTRWMCGPLAAVAGGAGCSGHLLLRAGCGCWAGTSLRTNAEAAERRCHGTSAADAAIEDSVLVRDHVVAAHHSAVDEAVEYAACARVKPGRGRPNVTMSCTDKVWRWSALGLQGRRRARLFPLPLRVFSVHVLQDPATPSSSADNANAAAKAASLFEWRTRSWWPSVTAADLARVTPQFVVFDALTLAGKSGVVCSSVSTPGTAGLEAGDSCYSRCRWLTVHRAPSAELSAPRKRVRTDEATSCGAALRLDWRPTVASAGAPGLVLNTKAGLPQGMTARGLAQRVLKSARGVRQVAEGALDSPDTDAVIQQAVRFLWRQCPLSRPWMAQRLERVLAATCRTSSSPLCAEAWVSSVLPSSVETDVCDVPAVHDTASPADLWATVMPRVSMRELAHQRHAERTRRSDAVLFLWSTAGCDGGEGEKDTEEATAHALARVSDVASRVS